MPIQAVSVGRRVRLRRSIGSRTAINPALAIRMVVRQRMLSWAMGAPARDAGVAGGLLGVKLALTEFTAFIRMAEMGPGAMEPRTRVIMTYALCGFANVASVGINVAGFSVLAPERRSEIIGMVWKAMMAGFLATCLTASIVGLLPAGLFGG